MPLVLVATRMDAPSKDRLRRFSPLEGETATIGAGRDADWPLPDTAGRVAARHCEVTLDGGSCRIRNLSGEDLVLAGSALSAGSEGTLAAGEGFELGPFRVTLARLDPPVTPGTVPAQRGGDPAARLAGPPDLAGAAPDALTVVVVGNRPADPAP